MEKPLKERSDNCVISIIRSEGNCSRSLINQLKKENCNQTKSAEYIAAVIVLFYLSRPKLKGVKLPTQKYVARKLEISPSIIEQMWNLLRGTYRIIECRRSTGTRFIAFKDNAHKRLIHDMANAACGNPGVNFYDATLSGFASNISNWRRLRTSAWTEYQYHPCNDESADNLELEVHLQHRFSAIMESQIKIEEITFAGRYRSVIEMLIGKNGHLKGELVVVRPNILLEDQDPEASIRMLDFFGFKGHELLMSQLADFCSAHSQVIVYYVPKDTFGFSIEDAQRSWQRLIDLQHHYGFNVILHDRYHLSGINNIIFNSLTSTGNTFLYYIAPACLLDIKLAEINVLICPAKQLAVIKKKNPRLHDNASIAMIYALCHLLRSGQLDAIERLVKKNLFARVEVAKKIILQSGLFKEEHVQRPSGWFFYLEPKEGKLPTDIIPLLKKVNQLVVEPIVFWSAPQFEKGIVISISSFVSDSSMAQHLKTLMSDISSNINPTINQITKPTNYEAKSA
jgi:hypothetical protein